MVYQTRIGIIFPTAGLADMDLYMLAPEGVSVHVTRLWTEGEVTIEEASKVGQEDLGEAGKMLLPIKPHVIAWACTSGSFCRGNDEDEEQVVQIRNACGVPATTTSTGIIKALRRLGIKKVAVGAPYLQEVTNKLVELLERRGQEVVNVNTLNCPNDWVTGNKTEETIFNMVVQADHKDAEAIVVPDTALIVASQIEKLEQTLGKPVITANQATIWHALRVANSNATKTGYGILMRTI